MNILGINFVPGMVAWQHDSAAALVKDGVLIASAEEERFNRVRHYRGFPHRAIAYCLEEGGIALDDVDIIAVSYHPLAFLRRGRINLYWQNLARDIANIFIFYWYKRQVERRGKTRVVFVDHHLAHAASAYYCSGFKDANVLTIDGSGETESYAFFVGQGNALRRVWDIALGGPFDRKKSRSIGLVYTRVTDLLGLGVNGEGKTMGLASYGKPTYDFSDILRITNHTQYTINRSRIGQKFAALKRAPKDPITQEHKDLAASLQAALEESVVNLAREAYGHSGLRRFALAGGVALNCNTNSKLLEQEFCDDLFIQPAASDSGAALGAALAVAAQHEVAIRAGFEHAYWGPGFTNEQIEQALKEAKAPYKHYDDIEHQTAKLVHEGKIVGWFQGRMEIGPRALGDRSILADPSRRGMDGVINREVKHREEWRPFAPSVAQEDAARFFEGLDKAKDSSFMLHTFYVRPEYRDKLPAITHTDGSSRIQTVRPAQNARYHRFLKELEKLSGFPVVMNTSFNDKNEPIVCTPQDALRCFYATGFDVLAIGNYLVEKNQAATP
jgi:carbamoyltransferase